jgi:hypothetical protein
MQNQIDKVQSTNYQTPQLKLRSSLIEVAKTSEERTFVNSISHLTILETSQRGKEFWDKLIDILAKWRWMSGINTNNQNENDLAKELTLLASFVFENYQNITYEEISLAINLSLTNKLDCDVRTFNSFSPMYVSRILNAYQEYKRGLYNDLMRKKETFDNKLLMEKKPTPKEKMDGVIDLIRYFYEEYKEKGIINDHFNTLYNFFRRTNKLNPSKEVVNEALEYAKIKVVEHNNEFGDFVYGKEKPNKENLEKKYARNYCVQKLFDNINIDEFIKTIKIEEFE